MSVRSKLQAALDAEEKARAMCLCTSGEDLARWLIVYDLARLTRAEAERDAAAFVVHAVVVTEAA